MNFPFCESIGAGVLIPFVDINFITSNSFNKFSFLCFLVSKNLITMFLSWLRKTLSSNPPRSSSLSESTPYTFSDCLIMIFCTMYPLLGVSYKFLLMARLEIESTNIVQQSGPFLKYRAQNIIQQLHPILD